MKLQPTDWHWLRAATVMHPGFHLGMPWNLKTNAYDRLEKKGFVQKLWDVDSDGQKYAWAYATKSGRAALNIKGQQNERHQQMCGENRKGTVEVKFEDFHEQA